MQRVILEVPNGLDLERKATTTKPRDISSTNYNFVEHIVGSLSNLVYTREVLDLGPVGIIPLKLLRRDKAALPQLVVRRLLEQLANVESDRLAILSKRQLNFTNKGWIPHLLNSLHTQYLSIRDTASTNKLPRRY